MGIKQDTINDRKTFIREQITKLQRLAEERVDEMKQLLDGKEEEIQMNAKVYFTHYYILF